MEDAAFAAATRLAFTVAGLGAKAGRYEITVTALVRDNGDNKGSLERVEYSWRQYDRESVPQPSVFASLDQARDT
jgi:hypothetical protein